MVSGSTSSKNILYFLVAYLILWILLFEFILPVNEILPKPSIVILSFGALWNVYHLPINFLSTVSIIYLSIAVSYLLIFLLKGFLIKNNHLVKNFFISLHWFSIYIPGIVLGLFLIYWFPNSFIITFVFALCIVFFSIVNKFQMELSHINHNYVDSAKSLGADEKIISNKIIWNSIQHKLADHIIEMHYYLWTVLIIFEFIKGEYGLGVIFKQALNYKDLSALFSASIITGITLFAGLQALKYLRNKFFHWGTT